MATRWTSKHTGQKIDDTIDCVCNPNLLDNWYFGNPVNQRGDTQHTGASATYFIDRWRCGSYNQTIELTQQGLRWSSNTGIWLMQPIENYDDLVGKVVTVSALIDNVLYSATGTVSKTGSIATRTSSDVYLEVTHAEKGVRFVTYSTNTQQISILAVKLELGPQQTLAHQDADGNWVLNEIPDYGEQLRRCQRYFCRFNFGRNDLFFGSLSTNLDRAWITIPTPVVMRTAPSISFSKTFNVIIRGNGFQVEALQSNSTVAADTSTTRCCNILITPNTKPSAWTAQQVVMIYTSSEWYMDCSADL